MSIAHIMKCYINVLFTFYLSTELRFYVPLDINTDTRPLLLLARMSIVKLE